MPLPPSQPGLLSTLTPFDWGILAVLAASTIAAFMRGFIRSIFSLVGIILGIVLAAAYHDTAADYLAPYLSQPGIASLVGFLLILFAVVITASLLGRVTRSACSAVGLGFMDRLGGALFGFLRGCLLLTALLMPLAAFLPRTTLLDGSRLSPYFLSGAHGVSFMLPNDFKNRIEDGAHRLQRSSDSWLRLTRSHLEQDKAAERGAVE